MTEARSPTSTPGQRIAVVGSGIAGLASAYLLARRHHVTLFEADKRLGGHTHTVDITLGGVTAPVDTGFLVFNDRTYPNLIALFDELGVASHASDMSFGVSVDAGRLEWAGSNLGTVFAQPRNLVSPGFLGMLADILRFNREAPANLRRAEADGATLGQLLAEGCYRPQFRDAYLLPMAAAIWSSPAGDILQFPAASFLRFCLNHGLLQINDRPQWRSPLGGGRSYVQRIAATLPDVRLNAPVHAVHRNPQGVLVHSPAGPEQFDAVVLATHAPETLALLQDPDDAEAALLRAVRYQPNVAVLHTDARFLPQRRKVWSAWNYLGHSLDDGQRPVCVSYLLNQLQPLPFTQPVIVTLNPFSTPDPAQTHGIYTYEHPLFDNAAIAAQKALPGLQGRRSTWFAGAWTGYGFHEDGLRSALRVAADWDLLPAWARL